MDRVTILLVAKEKIEKDQKQLLREIANLETTFLKNRIHIAIINEEIKRANNDKTR